MKILRIIAKIFLVAVIVGIALLAISIYIFYSFDINQHKNLLIAKFSEVTGQELSLNGPLAIKLLPLPYIELKNANLSLKLADKKIKISTQYLKANFKLKSLFTQQKEINAVTAKNIVLKLINRNELVETLVIDEFSGQIISSCCEMNLPSFVIKAGDNDLTGELKVVYGRPYQIIAKLFSKTWVMMPNETVGEELAPKSEYLDWLKNIEAKVQFNVEHLQIKQWSLKDADLKIAVHENSFKLSHRVTHGGKVISGECQVKKDEKTQKPVIHSQFSMEKTQGRNLAGNLTLLFLKNATILRGQLYSPSWQLDLFDGTAKKGLLFSRDPFAAYWLKNLQGEIDYKIENLTLKKVKLQDTLINLKFKNNRLAIMSTGSLATGRFKGKFSFEQAQKRLPEIKGELVLNEINATEFFKFFKHNSQIDRGRLNLTFTGRTRGNSEADLMAHLSGDLLLQIDKMKILNQTIDSRYVGFLAAFWKNLLPHKNSTLLKCAVMRMKITDGIAYSKNGIGLETRELYVLGTGALNLRTEELDYVFTLSPQNQINLEVGSYENIILLKGTLAQPRLVAAPQGIIREGGSLLLGYTTGGVSILAEKIFKLMMKKDSPCQEVFSNSD